MRKNEKIHKTIQRFMECCAQVQKCNMDNKFYNEQKEKYANLKKGAVSGKESSNEDATGQLIWLNQKVEELQDELKRRSQMINKLKNGK